MAVPCAFAAAAAAARSPSSAGVSAAESASPVKIEVKLPQETASAAKTNTASEITASAVEITASAVEITTSAVAEGVEKTTSAVPEGNVVEEARIANASVQLRAMTSATLDDLMGLDLAKIEVCEVLRCPRTVRCVLFFSV